jgi:hypothetical protein
LIGTKHAWESEEQEEDILDRFLKVKKFADNRIVSCESKPILFWKFNNIVSSESKSILVWKFADNRIVYCESKSVCLRSLKMGFYAKVSKFVLEVHWFDFEAKSVGLIKLP